jgi:hypothetical protein
MNFRELNRNKLQQECKSRGIKANGKTLELIATLENYELSKKKDDPIIDNQVSVDLGYGDLTSFDIFGIDVSVIEPIINEVIETKITQVSNNEVSNNEVNHTQVTKSKVYIAKPIKQDITSQVNNTNVSNTQVTNKVLSYEQLDSFYNKGFICLNNNSHITGIDARIMLSKLWVNYPIIQPYLTDYEDHTSILKVQFGLSKEITEGKKIIKKGRNLTPAKVEYGKEVNRTIYVQNDRGNDLGLPSDKRSPYKSGLKHGIIDHTSCSSIYIDDKLIYSLSGSVLKLQSEAYNRYGKSKEHKADCGYIGQSKNTKNKRNTGVKMTSSVQQGVNTNLMGNLFKLAGYEHKMQVEIASNGTLYLNQYIRTEKIQSSIGKIGELDSSGRYQIEYATNYKLASNAVVDRHIQAIIIKATHHDIGFLKTQVTVTEPTQQLSRRAKKAIKKQQANRLLITSDTNLVSLVKK